MRVRRAAILLTRVLEQNRPRAGGGLRPRRDANLQVSTVEGGGDAPVTVLPPASAHPAGTGPSGTVRAHRRGPREVSGKSRPGFHFSESSKSSESHLQSPSSSVSAAVTVCGLSTRHPPTHEEQHPALPPGDPTLGCVGRTPSSAMGARSWRNRKLAGRCFHHREDTAEPRREAAEHLDRAAPEPAWPFKPAAVKHLSPFGDVRCC